SLPAVKIFSVRGAGRLPIRLFVIVCLLRRFVRDRSTYYLSDLFPRKEKSLRILMWILSIKDAKRLFNISIKNTDVSAPLLQLRLLPIAPAVLFGMSARHLDWTPP